MRHLAGHAHSLLFYHPTDLYVDAVSYLDETQETCIGEWIGEGIVRPSTGLENVQDLIADVARRSVAAHSKGWSALRHTRSGSGWDNGRVSPDAENGRTGARVLFAARPARSLG